MSCETKLNSAKSCKVKFKDILYDNESLEKWSRASQEN